MQGTLEKGQLVVPFAGTYDPKLVTWLPPVPNFSKMIGLALNYQDHAAELNLQLPPHPILFNKNPNTLIGHKGKVIAPRNIEYMHYENELVVVIGMKCRKVKAEHAERVILGYTIGNDVTIRDFVDNFYRPPVKAKGFDTFGPLGPYLVTIDEVPDSSNLNVKTYVNNELRQQGNTKDFIYNVPQLIEYITEFMTLEPGDMIWTGTPKGISHVHPGDVMKLEIETIGMLENEVVEAKE
ncbi:MAG: fumarylacetoacetate hydrolase family protein [Chloroflexi bacterium]|nr:fumarylacetoacetate hydrolase family protein [Chloroflexota bacterium]